MIHEFLTGFLCRWEVLSAAVTLFAVYWFVSWLQNPLRKIPGPKGSWLFGNSKDLSRPHDGHKVLVEWGKKYGDVYKTWDIIGMIKFFHYSGISPLFFISLNIKFIF